MKKIYVCSPLKGDYEKNTKMAQKYARFVASQGHMPIVPHLFFPTFLDDLIPEERALGLAYGLRLLEESDELWVFGSQISEGMQAEIELWESGGREVFYFPEILLDVPIDQSN